MNPLCWCTAFQTDVNVCMYTHYYRCQIPTKYFSNISYNWVIVMLCQNIKTVVRVWHIFGIVKYVTYTQCRTHTYNQIEMIEKSINKLESSIYHFYALFVCTHISCSLYAPLPFRIFQLIFIGNIVCESGITSL